MRVDLPRGDRVLAKSQPNTPRKLTGDASALTLRYRDLTGCDLNDTTGLPAWELAGSDLTGARLPEGLSFDLVDRAQNAARDSSRVFVLLLGGALVCWLVRIGTTDAEMALDSIQASLPFVDYQIKISYFYALAPALLLLGYLYFHLGLQQIWDAVTNLPIFFPDGLRIDKKLYPWPLLRISELVFPQLWRDAGTPSRARPALTALLFWLAIPASLVSFWLHYISQRSVVVSSLHIFYLGVALAADVMFFRMCVHIVENSRTASEDKTTVDLGTPLSRDLDGLTEFGRRGTYLGTLLTAGILLVATGYTVGVFNHAFHWPGPIVDLNMKSADLRGLDLQYFDFDRDVKIDGALCDARTSFSDPFTCVGMRIRDTPPFVCGLEPTYHDCPGLVSGIEEESPLFSLLTRVLAWALLVSGATTLILVVKQQTSWNRGVSGSWLIPPAVRS